MKKLKQNTIYFLVLLVVGLTMIVMSVLNGFQNDMLMSMGTAMSAVSLVKLIQVYRISKNPQRLQQYEMYQSEERMIFIAGKSIQATFYATLLVEYIAMLAMVFWAKNHYAAILGYIVCAQLLANLAFRFYYSKKY